MVQSFGAPDTVGQALLPRATTLKGMNEIKTVMNKLRIVKFNMSRTSQIDL